MKNSTKSNVDIFIENADISLEAIPQIKATSRIEATLPKRCRPFILKVMVYSPESGYKFEIEVERNCSSANEPLWSFSFTLQKKIDKEFVDLVVVTYKAKDPAESKGIEAMAKEGITDKQLNTLEKDIYPTTKQLADEKRPPTSEEKEKVGSSMGKIAINL